jgi:alginate O-acetyltransferase complex protein AlgI
MTFCSREFLGFFAGVLALYWLMPWPRARVLLLLAASIGFYASWNVWLATIIIASTTVDYGIARGLDACSSCKWRRVLISVSVCGNLGLLGYFKYTNFFLHSLQQALNAAGADVGFPVLRIVVPIGISFYTFEAISYTVDVYRHRIQAERNLAHLLVFILFFPHLVSGPIVRARDFLPQIRRVKCWDWLRLELGVQYFLMGLFKKLVIADRMAMFADPVFANPSAYGTGALWIGTLAYTIQAFCDFSGYSDMAIGAAHMLGYKLSANFNLPYLAMNITESWRRWHISLSTWLRDYVFVPLGGSRRGSPRTALNLFITMGLCGLWHGASWNFVVFGLVHAGLLTGHRAFRVCCERYGWLSRRLDTAPGKMGRVLVTFLTWALALVLFRNSSVAQGIGMLSGMIAGRVGASLPLPLESWWVLIVLVAVCHAMAGSGIWQKSAYRLPYPVIGFGYACVLVITLLLTLDVDKPFIYFQF